MLTFRVGLERHRARHLAAPARIGDVRRDDPTPAREVDAGISHHGEIRGFHVVQLLDPTAVERGKGGERRPVVGAQLHLARAVLSRHWLNHWGHP